jgi:hypothetical protein
MLFSAISLLGMVLLMNKKAAVRFDNGFNMLRSVVPFLTLALQFGTLEQYRLVVAYSLLGAVVLGLGRIGILKLYALYVACLIALLILCFESHVIELFLQRDFKSDKFFNTVFNLSGFIGLIGGCLAY